MNPSSLPEEGWFISVLDGAYGPFPLSRLDGFLRPRMRIRHPVVCPEGGLVTEIPALHKYLYQPRAAIEWWFVRRSGGETQGPFTRQALVAMLDSGEVGLRTEIRHASWDDFLPVEKTRLRGRVQNPDYAISALTPDAIRAGGVEGPAAPRASGLAALRLTWKAAVAAAVVAAAAVTAAGYYLRPPPPPLRETHSTVVGCGGPADNWCGASERSRCICEKTPRFCGCAPDHGRCEMPTCVSLKRAMSEPPPAR